METKLCLELEKIKKENPKYYTETLTLLNFMYGMIKSDYMYKINSLNEAISRNEISNAFSNMRKSTMTTEYSDRISELETQREFIVTELLQSVTGIEELLFDMIANSDKRFIDLFIEKTSIPIDLIKNDILVTTDPYYYLYNLSAMLVAYDQSKDNFAHFRKVVEDICFVFVRKKDSNENKKSKKGDNQIKKKLKFLRNTVTTRFYETSSELQKFLNAFLTNLEEPYSEAYCEQLNTMFKYLSELEHDLDKFLKCGYNIDRRLVKRIVEDITLYIHDFLLPGVEPFYDRALLLNNRYDTLKEAVKVVDPYLREEVLSYFRGLNLDLFTEINSDKDSYSEYVKIIFDSDTYHELLEKLNAFTTASQEYTKGNREEAFRLLRELSENKRFKQRVNDKIITYPMDSNNMVTKPNLISKRMMQLYRMHDLLPEDKKYEITSEKNNTLITLTQKIKEDMDAYRYRVSRQESKEEKEPEPIKKKSRFSLFG